MRQGMIRHLFRKGANNSVVLMIASTASGSLNARPIVTYTEHPVSYTRVNFINNDEKSTDAGIDMGADVNLVLEPFAVTGRPEFQITGKLDASDRVKIGGIQYEILASSLGALSGIRVVFLSLKRTKKVSA